MCNCMRYPPRLYALDAPAMYSWKSTINWFLGGPETNVTGRKSEYEYFVYRTNGIGYGRWWTKQRGFQVVQCGFDSRDNEGAKGKSKERCLLGVNCNAG
jgi:hypothetical protein